MMKHVVMWSFKEGVSLEDQLEMKRQLESLQGVVPSLVRIEIGLDVSKTDAAMDMVLCTEFEDESGLKAYATHPEHLKVVEFVKTLVCKRAVVDYII